MKEPELPNFIVKKYTPKVHKGPTHINFEWPVPRCIKLYDALIEASLSKNPVDIELRQMAREIAEEIANIIPKTY